MRTAAVGVVVAAPPEHASANAAGVNALAFTVKLIGNEAATPVLGVAMSVPAYVPAVVPLETVTVPQVAPAAHVPVGPLTVEPPIGAYEIEAALAVPVLLTVQLRVAAVGVVDAAGAVHALSVNTGMLPLIAVARGALPAATGMTADMFGTVLVTVALLRRPKIQLSPAVLFGR